MFSWWNSLEAVTALETRLKWIGGALILFAAVCGLVSLIANRRADTLRKAGQSTRTLSATQRRQILDLLANQPQGQVEVKCPMLSPESRSYARQFEQVLRDAGWQVTFNDRAVFTPTPTNLKIWTHTDREPAPGAVLTRGAYPDRAVALYDALKLAYLPVELKLNTSVPNDEVHLIIGVQ